MSLEIAINQRSESPANLGRSAPIHAKIRHKEDDGIAKKDKSFRRYASAVERVLSLFDTALEGWADYISFLGRLIKALQTRPAGVTEIPHGALVAKRLSQCLNPVLPSGVHQKALEAYAYIFASLGKDGLSSQLPSYLPGLTPVLSFASLFVKPALLSLFETYVLTLSVSSLRPALKAIILALLPGLEDETSEEFDRTFRILNAFKDVLRHEPRENSDYTGLSGDQYFWQCLFLASTTSPSRRPGALAYLTRNLPFLGKRPDQSQVESKEDGKQDNHTEGLSRRPSVEAVASPEPGLLIRCFCTGLRDDQHLIQRGFLDLLVSHLPMDSIIFQENVVPDDLQNLIDAASSVVARREMSLNRRLWSWFLGPEPIGEGSATLSNSPVDTWITPGQAGREIRSQYFVKYGLGPLVSSIKKMFSSNSNDPAEIARPLRICLSLMDRWEVGGLVVPQVFMYALQSVWRYHESTLSREAHAELLRSANMFFDGVESGLIWAELMKLAAKALDPFPSSDSDALDSLKLLLFVTTTFNIREEEMLTVHIPSVTTVLVIRVQKLLNHSNQHSRELRSDVVALALKIIGRLVDLIPQRAFVSEHIPENSGDNLERVGSQPDEESALEKIERFYNQNQGDLDVDPQPILPAELARTLLQTVLDLVAHMLRFDPVMSYRELDAGVNILNLLLRKFSQIEMPYIKAFLSSLLSGLSTSDHPERNLIPFTLLAAKVSAVEAVSNNKGSAAWLPERVLRQLIPGLLKGLWPNLSPTRPKHNVEAVRCIWRLQALSADAQLAESTITTLMNGDQSDPEYQFISLEDAQRFATIWTHSPLTSNASTVRRSSLLQSPKGGMNGRFDLSLLERPLFLLLDSLEDPKSSLFVYVNGWLQSLPNLHMIIGTLMIRLSELPVIEKLLSTSGENMEYKSSEDSDEMNDYNTSRYYLQCILHVIQYSSVNVWKALADPSTLYDNGENSVSSQLVIARICLGLITKRSVDRNGYFPTLFLDQVVLSILRQFLHGPSPDCMDELKLEETLLEELKRSVVFAEHSLQIGLMEVILVALRIPSSDVDNTPVVRDQKVAAGDFARTAAGSLTITTEGDRKTQAHSRPPPTKLLHCLMLGIASRHSWPVLDNWIAFLNHCLVLYIDSIFQTLLPLIECFCNTIGAVFRSVQAIFAASESETTDILEPILGLLLNGLEQSLATAHERLVNEDVSSAPVKSPEQQPQGFFGNMVSGVFTTEPNRSKTMTANSRLTVLICFKDAVRICYTIWSWEVSTADSHISDLASSGSFNYTSIRLRNRTRHILEHLFAAEALECLETLIELWQTSLKEKNLKDSAMIISLLHALEATRPKNAIPAIFNALYSRTNQAALDPVRKSTLTSNISDKSLAAFLVAYTRSLDDDAMDEIWSDCLTFLKDVLANPLPQGQILPRLLEFTAVIGAKVDNTNFGEQRKMRRELGDLFVRLLTATSTIRPMGYSHDVTPVPTPEKLSVEGGSVRSSLDSRSLAGPEGIIPVLAIIVPSLSKVLIDSDRMTSTTAIISTQILGPTIRSKSFPENFTQQTLDLMMALANIPEASKSWKKDVAEGFNDAKFFTSPVALVLNGWLPLLRQWALPDKERMPELLSRLASPTAAGIMFGVGATSARQEADRKSQWNLRRIALLILAVADDTYVINMASLQEKIVDLMTATPASSPSSATRAEIYMVIRALILKTSAIHMSSLWPTLNSELLDAISSAFPTEGPESPNVVCLLQACKLLDVLLALGVDDFQMQEWLFITDTTDAVYRPTNLTSVALLDELAESLDTGAGVSQLNNSIPVNTSATDKRRPLLTFSVANTVPREELMAKVLRPFFRQLSISTFESTYSMQKPDWKACFDDLLEDLFDNSTLV